MGEGGGGRWEGRENASVKPSMRRKYLYLECESGYSRENMIYTLWVTDMFFLRGYKYRSNLDVDL